MIFVLLFIVGVNCHFDPMMSLDALKLMKNGLEEAGLLDSVHLMCQPLAFKTPDAGKKNRGKNAKIQNSVQLLISRKIFK